MSVRNDKESDPEYVAAIKYVTKMSDSFQWLAIFRVILSRNVAEFAMLLHVILRALDTIGMQIFGRYLEGAPCVKDMFKFIYVDCLIVLKMYICI